MASVFLNPAPRLSTDAAMLTMSRTYPVPDGIGTLTNGVGGLRYSVTSGLLDLKPLLGSDGLFCGTGGSSGNFNAIKALGATNTIVRSIKPPMSSSAPFLPMISSLPPAPSMRLAALVPV